MIKDDGYGSYVRERVELMKVMKFSETEIEDFLDKHYEKLGVRIFLLRRYLKNDQQLEAINVLEDIMKIMGIVRTIVKN